MMLTHETFLNGVAGAMATGSSTDLVLHLMALAHEAGVELSLDDFDRISREVLFICNLQSYGKYPITSLDAYGGISRVMKNIESKLHKGLLTLGELLDKAAPMENDVIKTMERP